ncbi:nucleotidyltransferase substrate binding protein like protein [bacterium BMS3Bbin07]|nr:nucleotidyltransferase substrate binding protein like protein [bacterium BMS3Bbin07]
MMEEVKYSLEKLKKAFKRLDEAVKEASDELDRDGVIQRFEFTFEMFWKTVKILLEYEGYRCAGPRTCVKEAARRGFLQDAEVALDMLEDRNKTSHIYDETTAEEIFNRIKELYVEVISRNMKLFEDYLSG